MKNHPPATRVIAGVLPAMALFATPALAQIATQTAPPPVPNAVAPAPEAPSPAAPDTPDRTKYQASLDAATGKTASDDAPAAAPVARAARSAARAAPARPAPVRPALPRAAPAATTPTPAVTEPVPVPAPSASAAAAAPVVDPVATAPAEPAATTPEASDNPAATAPVRSGTPNWVWLLAGLAGLAVIVLGIAALRRRRATTEWDEPVADAPYVETAPVAAEPAYDEPVAEHADVVAPEADEVAAMTEAAAPVAGRPWIELSLRPIRAGATDDAALVDLELTLANAGEVEATDVRVSTFMLGDATSAPTSMDQLLAAGHHGADVDAGAIAAGAGSRIDARLAVPRDGMDGATFQPLVGVDVRYTLPDGSQGRTAAAFTVGVADDTDTPTPIRLGGDMREDVSAALHGVPERV